MEVKRRYVFIDSGDGVAPGVNQACCLNREVQIDGSYSPHIQEDWLTVPLPRLIDKLESGGS